MTDPTTSLRDEIAAMRRLGEALDNLPPAARGRVLRWMWDRFTADVDEQIERAIADEDELHATQPPSMLRRPDFDDMEPS